MAGFGSGISAIAFSTYVAGLLPTLILLGGVSDRIGRKTVILASLLFACVATFLTIAQPNIYTLFVTPVLQGIAVGLITGTGTAYLSTLMPQNATKVAAYVSLTTSLGFSSGALFTNAVLSYSNSLVPFSYWIVFILILGCIGLAIGIPEQPTTSGTLIRLPSFPPGAIWSLAGDRLGVVAGWNRRYHFTCPISAIWIAELVGADVIHHRNRGGSVSTRCSAVGSATIAANWRCAPCLGLSRLHLRSVAR